MPKVIFHTKYNHYMISEKRGAAEDWSNYGKLIVIKTKQLYK